MPNQPILVFIYGMPATGKSSSAIALGAKLGLANVVGTDEIRDVMQVYDKSPVLAGKSHDRWRLFGKPSYSNFIRGYLAHSMAIRQGVMAVINKNLELGESIILEGVHLTPSIYPKWQNCKAFYFLLTAESDFHHQQMLDAKVRRRHGIQTPWPGKKIRWVQQMQEYLLREARDQRVVVIKSEGHQENSLLMARFIEKEIESEATYRTTKTTVV